MSTFRRVNRAIDFSLSIFRCQCACKMSELTAIMKSQLKAQLGRGASKDSDYTLYHSLEVEQMLLPETAHFLATKTYFRMLGLPLTCEARTNAEFMSPSGSKTKLPILRAGTDLTAEFEPIVEFLQREGHTLWPEDFDAKKRSDWKAAFLDMDAVFTNAELYLCWLDKEVRTSITAPRYGCPYEWPLNRIQCWRKQHEVQRCLEVEDWQDFTLEDVTDEVKIKLHELSEKLQEKPFFNGTFPTEFDALIFGHLFAIVTTKVPNLILAEEINKNLNLVRFCSNIDSSYFSRKSSQ